MKPLSPHRSILILGFALALFSAPCGTACAETLGVRDSQGNFVPKMSVTFVGKDVLLKKTDPQERMRSFSLTLNSKNKNLIRNIGLIGLEWVDSTQKPSKQVPFAGPLYNPSTRVFQDSLTKSLGIKLIDKSGKNLFSAKTSSELFSIHVDDTALVSSDDVAEGDRTVNLGAGRDVSVNVDKITVSFNENNIKTGEIVNVENKSGLEQVFGIELPDRTLMEATILKKPEQTRVPRENWDRFNVPAEAQFSLFLFPSADPAHLTQLDGKEIIIKVFQGTKERERRKILIKVLPDLKRGALRPGDEPPTGEQSRTARTQPPVEQTARGVAPVADSGAKEGFKPTMWFWALQITNIVLILGLAVYCIFFLMPKLQVLEDRMAKNEMFSHGTREAVREQFEHMKEDINRFTVDDSRRD